MKVDISERSHIELLVNSFYDKVRKDEMIGDIFNNAIDDWEHHLIKLSDFWETNLLFVAKYKGHPPQMHIDVDQKENNSINQDHFNRWLELWFATVDDLFEGNLASLAKNRAQNIAGMLFQKILMARN